MKMKDSNITGTIKKLADGTTKFHIHTQEAGHGVRRRLFSTPVREPSVEPVDLDTPSVIRLIDEILKCSEEQSKQDDTHMEVDGEDSEEESLLAPSTSGKDVKYSRDMDVLLDKSPAEPPSKKTKKISTPRERLYYPECEPISS